MSMASASRISFWQKLDFLPAIFQISFETLAAAIWWPLRGERAPRTFTRHILLSLMRKTFARLSTEQLQFIAGSTESNYIVWARAQKTPVQSIQISHLNTKAFWIGDDQADTVVLYFHGGGFAMPGSVAHFTLLSQLISSATQVERSVAALVLQYDLAPAEQYPRQLTQAVELLRYVITDLKKSPGQIVLGGDSAGGNLVFGVLSHILHPHPSITPLQLSTPLRAAFVSSPVARLTFTAERFRLNEIFEPSPVSTLKEWVANFLGTSEKDGWNEPWQNDVEWWNGLTDVVKGILITVATDEVMADDIQAMASKITTAYPELTLFSSKNDFHAEPGIGVAVGLEESESTQFIKSWLVQRLL
ncbi:Alpha/Beta hydrolase protein [Lipomyces kononenkoae]|uniref:Alpha/Beta hydrolase protein n=1 Tax=Lipomyces kononenkoae TaxID=34357 RepID=A0ACC3SWY4_LIPKO